MNGGSEGAPSSSLNVPDADAKFLQQHYRSMSVPEMAKKLKRAAVTVYGFMAALGLPPRGRLIDNSHPFVQANHRLRATLQTFKDANEDRRKG